MNVFDLFVELVKILLVLAGGFLRAVALVAIALGVLWLIGHFFPNVAQELGLPCHSVYVCIRLLSDGLQSIKGAP